jgi:UDP-N-acetylmuramate dehydrogenase
LALKPKQNNSLLCTAELTSVLEQNKSANKFLGGGSNMLLTKDIDALVIHIDLKGKELLLKMKIMFG